jgi:hypothetical protein
MRRIAIALIVFSLGLGAAAAPASAAPRCPGPGGHGNVRIDTKQLIGLKLAKAKREAAKADCIVRVVRRDGKTLPRTEDRRPNRINVIIRRGVVRGIDSVG